MITILGVVSGIYFERYTPRHSTATTQVEVPDRIEAPAFFAHEVSCLTRIVYNESRNQPRLGQVAVAATVINRSLSAKFKERDLCAVVGAKRQFANHEPVIRNKIDAQSMQRAEQIAKYAIENYGALDPSMREFLYFNSNKAKRNSTTIGAHHFNA